MTDPFTPEPRPVATRSVSRQATDKDRRVAVNHGERVVVTSIRIPFDDVVRLTWQISAATSLRMGMAAKCVRYRTLASHMDRSQRIASPRE